MARARELDRRSGRPHWSHGSRVAFQFDRYDRPIEALALHSGQAEGAQFTRYRVEGEISRSISRDPRTLRLSFAAVDQRLSNGSRPLQLPDFVTLGGSAGLGGYEVGRFRDLDLLEAKLMYIFPLLEYLEFDIHYETGGVYADIERDPRLDTLKHTAGFAFRPRLPMGPLGAIGIDWSKERTRFRFSLGGVE
jgi:outer membrane protein assembly factor BamA